MIAVDDSTMGVSPFSKQNFADDLWNGFKAVLGSEKRSEKKSAANMSTHCNYLIRHVNGSNMFQIYSSLSNFRHVFGMKSHSTDSRICIAYVETP